MDLRNQTSSSAGFFNCVVAEDELMASVVSRLTYRLEDSKLVPDDQDPLPVQSDPLKLPEGELDRETPFLRSGVELIIIGKAYAKKQKPIREIQMEIQVGKAFKRTISITGNRIWQKAESKLMFSEPQPFVEMPLSYKNAYGGKALSEAGPMDYSANPEGKGFYLYEDQAVDQPLPNLENPEQQVEAWEDQPIPLATGPYPSIWSLRVLNSIEFSEDRDPPRIERIKPELYNNAHPAFIIYEPVQPGDEVLISHLTPDGPFRFIIPELAKHVHVQLEKRHFLFPLDLESIVILGDQNRVFFTLRVAFCYQIIPMERRTVSLYDGHVPREFPENYVIDYDVETASA